MHYFSCAGPQVRWRHHALCVVTALALSACGGDSSHRRGERTLTDTSAPTALLAVTNSFFASPKVITYMPTLIQQVSSVLCSTGSVTITQNDGGLITGVTYADCLEDFGGISTLTDGTLHFEYAEDDTLVNVVAEGFLEHFVFQDIEERRVTFDGELDFPDGPGSPVSYTANGTYQFVHTAPDADEDVRVRFQDFQMASSSSGTNLIQHLSGSLLLPDSGAAVDLSTGENGLTRPTDSACPISGTLVVTANDGSHLNVLFGGEDHIVVTVNGVAQAERTCDAYLAFIGY